MSGTFITTMVIRLLILLSWVTTIAWFVLCLGTWLICKETTVVEQCYTAIRCATSMMFGYFMARAAQAVGQGIAEMLKNEGG